MKRLGLDPDQGISSKVGRSPLRMFLVVLVIATSLVIVLPRAANGADYQSVMFMENDNPIDQAFAGQTWNQPVSLTLFGNLTFNGQTPGFSNPGYVFNDWNTASNGSGTPYANGATYSFAVPVTLYAQWTENSVTFHENANGSDVVNSQQFGNAIELLTPFGTLSPAFSNPGYAFAGWTTNANGTGTSYANNGSYDFTAGDLSLYAQWTVVPTENVSFNPNGATGTVTGLSGLQGSSITLPNVGTLSYPNHTFSGWNTSGSGSGIAYASGASLTLNSDTVLYAQWSPVAFTVTYNTEGGTTSPTSVSFTFGSLPLTLPTPVLNGYTFTGWYGTFAGGTITGVGGAPYSPTSSTTLYAHWTGDTYLVAFNGGGGTVSPSSVPFVNGSSPLSLPSATLVGFTFSGWYLSLTGGDLVGAAGSTYTPTQSLVLYAQWIAGAPVSVGFNANGAKGAVASMVGPVGSSITVPGVIGLIRPGFTLVNWNTKADGSGTPFVTGSVLTLSAPMTLFAQWTGHNPALVLGAVGSFAGNTTILTNALKAQVQHFSVLIKARKYVVVTLYGYTTNTGLASRNVSISRQRANAVAAYLRLQLQLRNVTGVAVKTAGEGTVAGASSTANRRVEVFCY